MSLGHRFPRVGRWLAATRCVCLKSLKGIYNIHIIFKVKEMDARSKLVLDQGFQRTLQEVILRTEALYYEISDGGRPRSIRQHIPSKAQLFYLFFQPVKVVNDDSDEEVQREERTNDNKDNKIQIRSKTVVAFWLLVDLGKKRKKIIRIINKTVMRYACVSSRRGQLRKETGANRRLSRVTWPNMRRQAQTRDKKALLESGINAHPVNGEPRKRSKAESFSESSPLLYFPATRTKSLLKRLL